MLRRPLSSTRFVLCSMEKTQSPISPYTCYGLCALHYEWSARVPWSCLFLLHVHGLRARRYGLWASQGQELSKRTNCLDATYTMYISKLIRQPLSSTRSTLCSMEKTQSPISPYTCHGLRALRYGWSAAVPWSRLFLLYVHGLRARRYGLWASQGQEFSNELTARTLLILHIIALG